MRAEEIIPGYGSPEWTAMLERHADWQFKLAAMEPSSWRTRAIMLRRAANYIFEIHFAAGMRSIERMQSELEERRRDTEAQLSGSIKIAEMTDAESEEWQDQGLVSVYFLLMGYSIENLLKGILLSQKPELFDTQKMRGFNHHDLIRLCNEVGVELQTDEQEWLKKLTEYIEWQGKYPIPLRRDKDKDRTRGTPFKGREFQEQIEAIWTKMDLRLQADQRTKPSSRLRSSTRIRHPIDRARCSTSTGPRGVADPCTPPGCGRGRSSIPGSSTRG